MAKLDTDVRNLINHLYFEVSDTWQRMMGFLWLVDAFRAVPQRYSFDPAPPSGT
jgi:hypothetical protein